MKTPAFLILTSLALASLCLPAVLPAQQSPVISEFLAVNDTGIKDEDGQYSDWIEIYNPALATVSLEGWYLTDSRNNLVKWRFPAVSLAPYGYLTVFASGKDRTNPTNALHTNFRLDAGGEYLALVRPDGSNVVTAYAPEYPGQNPDLSYGLPMIPGPSLNLVATGSTARFLIPSADIGTAWTGKVFDDSGWTAGPLGMGYDGSTNYQQGIQTDIAAQMSNFNASAYFRMPFQVADPAQLQDLRLQLRYDDGFVAYLNGTEVARNNAPANLAWNSAATALHGSEPGGGNLLIADFDASTPPYTVRQASAAPAPTIQNAAAGSTGRFLRLLNDLVNDNINSVAFERVAAGVYPIITAQFDFRVTDTAGDPADGFAFMLIPTSIYGNSGVGVVPYAGIEEPNIANVFCVGFDVYPHGSINDVSVHWNGSELNYMTIPRSTIDLVSGTFHRCNVTLEYVTGGARVTVIITPNVNGTPGTSLTVVNQQLIAMPQYESRVEFGGRTGGANMSVDLDNVRVQWGYSGGLVPAEGFDLSSRIPLLTSGTNMLAIQGLNISATNADFLMSPQLVGRSISLVTATQVFLTQPTPGQINATGGEFMAPDPEFSISEGVYTNQSLSVALSSPLPDAVIRYTLDGTGVTEASDLYTNSPLVFTNSTLLVARVWAPGYVPSQPVARSYTLLDSSVMSFSSKLPIVILDSFVPTLAQDMNPKAPCGVSIIDVSELTGQATLTGRPDYHGSSSIEGRGQTSWGFNKKPMNLEFVDEYGHDKRVSFLDFPEGSDFVLLSIWNDKTFLNDYLAYKLHEEMGHYSMRRRFVEVFFNGNYPGTVSGTAPSGGKVGANDYAGIYLLLEKPRIDPNRVNMAKLEPEDVTAPDITGGYIWKKDKVSPGDWDFSTAGGGGFNGQALKYHDPRGEQLTPVQRAWLRDHLSEMESVLYGSNWRDPVNGYAKYIDVDSFVDQHWIVEFPKQIDGYRLSNYMSKDRNGKIKMEPIWDWNLSFGNAYYLRGGTTNGWYWTNQVEGITQNEHIWLRRLICGSPNANDNQGDPEFLQRITDRWGELRVSVFNSDKLMNQVDGLTNYLFEAALRDFARFPRLGTELWPNPNGAQNGTYPPTEGWHVNFATTPTYSGIIGELKKWIRGRYLWIENQFLTPPVLSRTSGSPTVPLTIYNYNTSGGTVYYTTDGSDPRQFGGGIASNARPYTAAISLPSNARVVARVYTTATNFWTKWSPPAKAVFGYPSPSIAVSELMYHPTAPPPGDAFYGAEEFEFIELVNTTGSAIDLTGFRFGDGIEFVFPPGPLQPTGSATAGNFDGAGTPYTASQLGTLPGATVTASGPSGSFLRLASQNSGAQNNRAAFNRTASGEYDRVVAEFDFRAANTALSTNIGNATLQDFDTGTTPYALTNVAWNGSAYPMTPSIFMPPEDGSDGSYLRLTTNGALYIANAIYFNQTATSVCDTVVASFDFRLASSGSPADGMGFVFMNVANYGASGVPVNMTNIQEEVNFPNALGVGFDIYNNANPPVDYDANHVSVHWNGAMVSTPPVNPGFNLVAGVFHRAQIVIRFVSGQARVSVSILPDAYSGTSVAKVVFDNLVINNVAPFIGRVAIGARTGGLAANQDIDNVNIQYLNSSSSGGMSLVLLPTAKFGISGAGSGLVDYVDVPALSNAFGLNFDMHSAGFVNNLGAYYNGTARGIFSVLPAAVDLDSGVFHHARLELARAADGSGSLASLVLTPDIYGAGGTPITVFSGLPVAGYLPGETRLELAGRSGGQNLSLDVDNVNVTYEIDSPNWLAAGQRILVVKNQAAFESRYGTALRIAGEYTGQLDNAGERILLLSATGEPLMDFTYGDGWYPSTDGVGPSLVVTNLAAPSNLWNDPAQWRASAQAGGSPGVADPAPVVFVPVVVNEVLAHPDTNSLPGVIDAIELHNPSATQSADISHWYLSDDLNTPRKYRIPASTVILPGGFKVFYETNFNAPGSGPGGFGLRAEGESVYLFSGDAAGNLTGYYHGFDYGASDPNTTFGRYVDSEGDDQFVLQIQPTLGATNTGPKVGPIVMTEVMYHPPEWPDNVDNQVHEFIELRNITGAAVPLYDPAHPENTWRLRDAVDFEFPSGLTLPAGARLLVVSFDPTWETDALDSFRSSYNLGPEVLLFGPYSGKLDNSSDSVELTKPGEPDLESGVPPYVLVDKVKYSDNPPWPLAADGAGFSLQRIQDAQFGNDPANWITASPTPGAASQTGPAPTIAVQPVSQTAFAYSTVSFSVTASGTGPLRYQWRFDGNNLEGQTASTLVVGNLQLSQAGPYQVVVMDDTARSSIESAVATLTLDQAAAILTQPTDQSVWPLTNVTFTVSARGNGPVSYQWLSNGVSMSGRTTASLTLNNVLPSFEADYSVLVTDQVGSLASSAAHLTVIGQPFFTVEPTNRVVALATNAVPVSVTNVCAAFSTTPVRYQWLFNGAPIQDATNATFIKSMGLADTGDYSVRATDSYGSTTSSNAYIFVAQRAFFTVQPTNVTVVSGQDAVFYASASGTEPMTFRWRRGSTFYTNGIIETVGTNSTFTMPSVSYTNDTDRISVVASNVATPSGALSATAILRVEYAPVITVQPTNTHVVRGTNATFSASYRANPTNSSYGWFLNETNLLRWVANLAAASPQAVTLTVTNVQETNEGIYTLVASNVHGLTVSTGAVLNLRRPPTILEQPQSLTVAPGSDAAFSVVVTGAPPFQFIWRFYGTNLAGAPNEAMLTRTAVQAAQAGPYSVVVTNALGSVTSAVATLTLTAVQEYPPVITGQPQSLTVGAGSNALFSVIATGTPPFAYVWRWYGTNLPGASNAATLLLTNVQVAQAGDYTVVVSNHVGWVTSEVAVLTVTAPPQYAPVITGQPQSLTVGAGSNALFSVIATGTPPFAYVWRWYGTNLPGASNAATLLLTNVQMSQAGDYTVVVTNHVGSATSAVAVLTVTGVVDTDGDGMPDDWELANGLNPNNPSDGASDKDLDGSSNEDEYLAGTDPGNPQSYLKIEAAGQEGNGMVLEFLAVSNRAYAVYYVGTVGQTTWTKLLPEVAPAPTNRVIRLTNAPPGTVERYYRLTIPTTP